jgi:hypothetical protein
VALDRKRQIITVHAAAVVGDPNEPPTAAIGDDLDALRAGVERILDQFLHHARRTLDNLASGDLVDHRFGKLADGHPAIIGGFVPEGRGGNRVNAGCR